MVHSWKVLLQFSPDLRERFRADVLWSLKGLKKYLAVSLCVFWVTMRHQEGPKGQWLWHSTGSDSPLMPRESPSYGRQSSTGTGQGYHLQRDAELCLTIVQGLAPALYPSLLPCQKGKLAEVVFQI